MSSPAGRRRRAWTRALVTALGACELAIALSAGSLVTLLVGALSGVLLTVVPWLPRKLSRATLVAALVGATVPFAVLTWWTVVVPVLAVLALVLGLPLVARRTADASPRRASAVLGAEPERVSTR